MDNGESMNEKKSVNKAKSYSQQTSVVKLKNEPVKRKSFYVNDAVKSLDLTLGKLKKSKLVNGEYTSSSHTSPARQSNDLSMDVSSSLQYSQAADNGSLMSMNFSHYELMRNLSHTNCNSDGAFSGSTCDVYSSPNDIMIKDERLERYFQSAEMWNRNFRDGLPDHSKVHFKLPDK